MQDFWLTIRNENKNLALFADDDFRSYKRSLHGCSQRWLASLFIFSPILCRYRIYTKLRWLGAKSQTVRRVRQDKATTPTSVMRTPYVRIFSF